MDSFGSLHTFVRVAETRSFVDAGRVLGVSAAAVGKSVARLEASMGVRLFHRSTRSVTLTAEGHLFLARCRRILAEAEAAKTELSERVGNPQGRLRVSLPTVNDLVLPVLADFVAAYPDIVLDLDFTDRMVDVIEEGFDAVLRVGEPADSRLAGRYLGSFNRYLIASPAYLREHGTPRTPADLVRHKCMHYRYPSTGRLEVWPLRGGAELRLPESLVCNDIQSRVHFAARGHGIAFVPDHSARHALANGSVVTLLDAYLDASSSFHLLWPSGRHVLPKLRVFIDFFSEHMFPDGTLRGGTPHMPDIASR
ncbi:LysR family transcriptional regulator [Luteibacter aegosomatissinici]|uniref:LysR family transcriptional regulator n=1 Tax=Luteibacter aegosomatissinici TaxID=2911539 RepID=UPI001FF84484|nr:LysR family transcriptional regulator [Luteibacter aegosomatissinici]UPG96025.1 LysR family transcriptional regulator [Luteibacter aegosomatissinici]